jgi:hypothetical protein
MDRHTIRLQSGGWWDFHDPSSSQFTIEDIAFNLAKEPRYNGATDGFVAYSVAQHGVNASHIVAPGFEFEALHHDDGEFAYKDVTTWLKRLIPDYRARLQQGEDYLAEWHGIQKGEIPEVKLADLQMLKMEKIALFQNHGTNLAGGFDFISDIDVSGLEAKVDLTPWPTEMAYNRWLARHEQLKYMRK